MSTEQSRVWGRYQHRNAWRPAYVAPDGTTYVAPTVGGAWRKATPAEIATFQRRVPQDTVGRIFDDTLYVVTA